MARSKAGPTSSDNEGCMSKAVRTRHRKGLKIGFQAATRRLKSAPSTEYFNEINGRVIARKFYGADLRDVRKFDFIRLKPTNFTRRSFAIMLDISVATLKRWETGRVAVPLWVIEFLASGKGTGERT